MLQQRQRYRADCGHVRRQSLHEKTQAMKERKLLPWSSYIPKDSQGSHLWLVPQDSGRLVRRYTFPAMVAPVLKDKSLLQHSRLLSALRLLAAHERLVDRGCFRAA